MIYIHIPFCRSKCHYCNFFSLASKKGVNDFAGAICTEARLRKEELQGCKVSSIYFGGGTPSLLPANEIEKIINTLNCFFTIAPGAEITLEANPEDISNISLRSWKSAGINRLSIGIQSFGDADLRYLHRSHNAADAAMALDRALERGFDNLSADLIYGIPTLEMEGWLQNLNEVGKRKIAHLSAYALTVEPATILNWRIANKRAVAPDDTAQAQQFSALCRWAKQEGYIHYEISNLCRLGMESRHNSGYWNGAYYLGLGPSAHSFNGQTRSWNVSNLGNYLAQAKAGHFMSQYEILTPADRFNEYVMTALRTNEGINLQLAGSLFGRAWLNHIHNDIKNYVDCGWVEQTALYYRLSAEGMLYADRIASSLFVTSGQPDNAS